MGLGEEGIMAAETLVAHGNGTPARRAIVGSAQYAGSEGSPRLVAPAERVAASGNDGTPWKAHGWTAVSIQEDRSAVPGGPA